MKTKILSTLLMSSLILVGCQSTDSALEENSENSITDETIKTQTESSETKDIEDQEAEEEVEDIEFQYKINPTLYTVEPIDSEKNPDEKLVLLTYDDAPYGNTLEIANALAERGVSAIFFVNGMYMEDDEGFETIQKVHEMGFEIANHTHTHATLPERSDEEQHDEIMKTNNIIKEATGEKARFFRAPHGMNTDYARQLVAEEEMTLMNWSFGYDWMNDYQDGPALAEITLNAPELGKGSNILMHDRTWTAEATPAIVDGLIEQGFTIVNPKLISNLE